MTALLIRLLILSTAVSILFAIFQHRQLQLGTYPYAVAPLSDSSSSAEFRKDDDVSNQSTSLEHLEPSLIRSERVNTVGKTTNKTLGGRKMRSAAAANETNSKTSIVAEPIYWRFDEAGPTVLYSKTHFLQSIPSKYRLHRKDLSEVESIAHSSPPKYNLSEYASHSHNTWPQKLHLYEMNPCIAVLPKSYRERLRRKSIQSNPPIYIVVYRVTHKNNCYDGTINLQLLGGSWEPTSSDYLGVALLDSQLNIMMESTFDLQNHPVLPYLNDYRIYNLRDQLYLTSMNQIVPFYLTLRHDSNSSTNEATVHHDIDSSWVPVPPAFPDDGTISPAPFDVWLRNYTACPVYFDRKLFPKKGISKNLLYFVSQDGSGDNSTYTDNGKISDVRVVHYPRSNPNDVRRVELDTPCGKQPITPFDDQATKEWYPAASFATIDQLLFPLATEADSTSNPGTRRDAAVFLRDRGSACCIDLTNPTNQKPVLVAVVHPKTIFPGKKLPKGIIPNTYLSRWIAFEPQAPYRIVARSGMFCLGYPTTRELLVDTEGRSLTNATTPTSSSFFHPLANDPLIPLTFAGETFKCPRIHFIMGLVEKVGDPSSALLSYGVSDCLSRVIEVAKDEIQTVIWPDPTP